MRIPLLLALLIWAPLALRADQQKGTDSPSAYGSSVSFLFARGVYAEETKGDLDEAILCYHRVLEADGAQRAIAAEVLCRLGSCYEKKHDIPQATACFTSLLSRYPEQAPFAAVANEFFAVRQNLLPIPFPDRERLGYRVALNSDEMIGHEWYWVAPGELNGSKTLRFNRLAMAPVGRVYTLEALVKAPSLIPLSSQLRSGGGFGVDTQFKPGHAETRSLGSSTAKEVELKGVVYDFAEILYLIRLLPLELGFKWNCNIYGGYNQTTVVPFAMSVDALEKVTVPAGTWDCYRISTSLRQTVWVAKAPTRPWVKWQGDSGTEELVSIDSWSPNETMHFQDLETRIRFDAPVGWRSARLDSWDFENQMTVVAADPVSLSILYFSRRGLDDLKAKEAVSPMAWAKSRLSVDLKDQGKSKFRLREGSLGDRIIDGLPAAGYLADFVDPVGPEVDYSVFCFNKGNAIAFRFVVPAPDFERLRPGLDASINSFHID